MDRIRWTPALAALVALTGCLGVRSWNPTLHDAADARAVASAESPFLKVHTADGGLFVLHAWDPPGPEGTFEGSGWRYDRDRTISESGRWSFRPGEIALLEANRPETVSRFAYSGLVTYTVLWGITTGACLADPKSCFGSCPTFYGEDPLRPLAEGFSRSFARALEERDVDDLRTSAAPGPFRLTMRNEALETHAVRHARLVAVPLPPGATAHPTSGGDFLVATGLVAPEGCTSPDGDCRRAVTRRDDVEYAPATDGRDLAAREEVVLRFASRQGPSAVVLSARQSLVSTYLFYQALAWAGTDAGRVLAALERGEPWARDGALAIPRRLGDIEVFVRQGVEPWSPVGIFDEAGPIAADTRILPFEGTGNGRVEVKLRMARGSWRVDQVGVAAVSPAASITVLDVDSVTGGRDAEGAASALRDPSRHLVTTPGSALDLWFTLPAGTPRHALFLDSQGFYYEWMREEWLPEGSLTALNAAMLEPDEVLRRLAPDFKLIEPRMEALFWSSRFRR